jgi:hypothetical protein
MAAFEKGRMQGEMEAIRRMEHESNNTMQLKQFPQEQMPVQQMQRPDVVSRRREQRGREEQSDTTAPACTQHRIVWRPPLCPALMFDPLLFVALQVEINRLTWLQRGAWTLGELTGVALIVLTLVWIMTYRNDFAWSVTNNNIK